MSDYNCKAWSCNGVILKVGGGGGGKKVGTLRTVFSKFLERRGPEFVYMGRKVERSDIRNTFKINRYLIQQYIQQKR
jgi:hypothetical protein